MNYLSLCSGIEAASVAWIPIGFNPVAFSEIEPFSSSVLKHHYPQVPDLGDMTKFKEWPDYAIDILVGGTPCQSFSVAGLRKGLDDPRGNLALTFGAIAARYRPRWIVWENVYGVLSSNGGKDFAGFLGLLTGQSVTPPEQGWQNSGAISGYRSAYGVSWRTLNSEYFGVAQRRRRVFAVGYLGDWRRSSAALFERNCLPWNSPKDQKTGKTNARSAGDIATVRRRHPQIPTIIGTVRARTPGTGGRVEQELGFLIPDVTHNKKAVRRLTCVECERLMGFSDQYTNVKHRNRDAGDGPRYRALGNSIAVPCLSWLGARIKQVDEVCRFDIKNEGIMSEEKPKCENGER